MHHLSNVEAQLISLYPVYATISIGTILVDHLTKLLIYSLAQTADSLAKFICFVLYFLTDPSLNVAFILSRSNFVNESVQSVLVRLRFPEYFLAYPRGALHELHFVLRARSKQILTSAQPGVGTVKLTDQLSPFKYLFIVHKHIAVCSLVLLLILQVSPIDQSLQFCNLHIVFVSDSCDFSKLGVFQNRICFPEKVINQ